ncbi:MAG: hypothetical protein AAF632_23145 [Bacteroidota bacterium]
MKMFNAKDTKKTSKKRAWLTVLLIGILAAGTVSCSEEDDDNGAPVNPGTEAESGWITAFQVGTPNGRINYLIATENIPESFNITEAIELGIGQSISSFGEHPYVWDANARTMTKWSVDKTDFTLSVEGIMSLAATGFSPDFVLPAYISESQAYIFDVLEGIVVEWSPQDMTITEIHQVTSTAPLHDNPQFFIGATNNYIRNGKVFLPIRDRGSAECCEINTASLKAIIAVFDTETNIMTYETDPRIMFNWDFMPVNEVGDFLVSSTEESPMVAEYFNVEPSTLPSSTTLLKFNSDGTFDPDFAFDLSEVMDIRAIGRPFSFGSQGVVLSYWDSNDDGYPEVFSDRYQHRNASREKIAKVDFNSGTAEDFPTLSKYLFLQPYIEIDGSIIHGSFSLDENEDFVFHFIRQDAFDQFEELTSYGADGNDYISATALGKLWGD